MPELVDFVVDRNNMHTKIHKPTAPKTNTPVNQTSGTDWQMAVRWDHVINSKQYKLMSSFSITLLLLNHVAT